MIEVRREWVVGEVSTWAGGVDPDDLFIFLVCICKFKFRLCISFAASISGRGRDGITKATAAFKFSGTEFFLVCSFMCGQFISISAIYLNGKVKAQIGPNSGFCCPGNLGFLSRAISGAGEKVGKQKAESRNPDPSFFSAEIWRTQRFGVEFFSTAVLIVVS